MKKKREKGGENDRRNMKKDNRGKMKRKIDVNKRRGRDDVEDEQQDGEGADGGK